MAYPKITVNTGLVLDLSVKSDIVDIPWPGAQITGSGTFLDSGANTATNNDQLIDGGATFTSATAPFPVVVGDKVYNTTTPGNALVTGVAATTLDFGSNIFPNTPENYLITRPNHLIDTTATFITSGVKSGDIIWNTLTFEAAYVITVNNEVDLTLSADLFGTNVTANDNYTIFTGQEGGLKSSEGCLLYVGDSAQSSEDTSVMPVGNSTGVLFKKFPAGNYLPVQIKRLFATGSNADGYLAIW
tara:strand:- start:2034 stop:2765 length:732 start_codon:yes stop_codon:yes gene_type:complete